MVNQEMFNFYKNERKNKMALVSLRQLLDDAAEHGYGIPAFNVNNNCLKDTRAILFFLSFL